MNGIFDDHKRYRIVLIFIVVILLKNTYYDIIQTHTLSILNYGQTLVANK